MRHAFLIISHNEFEILQRLISQLDSEECDIYVHIDKKVKKMPDLKASKSGLYILSNRIDVRWGHVSQIKCEYALFREAYLQGNYCFYHLISGVHLPLKPINQILSYYENHLGENILPNMDINGEVQREIKIKRYNFFIRWFNYGAPLTKRVVQYFWNVSQKIQRLLRISHNNDIEYRASSNWVSLSPEGIALVLSKEKEMISRLRFSFCGDEWLVATVLINSELSRTIISPNNVLFCSMGDANAQVLCMKDYDSLMSSGCLWARKFSGKNMELVDMITNDREED